MFRTASAAAAFKSVHLHPEGSSIQEAALATITSHAEAPGNIPLRSWIRGPCSLSVTWHSRLSIDGLSEWHSEDESVDDRRRSGREVAFLSVEDVDGAV